MARKSPAKSVQYARASSVTFGQVAVVLVLCSLCGGAGFLLGQMHPRPLLETFRSNVVTTGAVAPTAGPWRPPADEQALEGGAVGSAPPPVEMPVVPAIEITDEQVREEPPVVVAVPEPVVAPAEAAEPAGEAGAPEDGVRVLARAETETAPPAAGAPVAVAPDAEVAGSPRALARDPVVVPTTNAAGEPSVENDRIAAAPARGRPVPRQAVGAAPSRSVEIATVATADGAERVRQRLRDLSVVAHVHTAADGGFQLVVEGVTSDEEAERLRRLGRQALADSE